MKLKNLTISPEASLRNIGWNWMLGEDTLTYITNEMVVVSETEAEKYFDAANELYEMYIAAAQHVIDNERYAELGIPANLIELIEDTWGNDANWHIYGRFDLSGGIDGKPIKLIEFNADTATCIPETAIVQWASLKANYLDESQQFNTLYETFVEKFRELHLQNPSFEKTLLISTLKGFPEDETNMQVLGEAAKEAGFEVVFDFIENVEFSAIEGIFKQNPENGSFTKYDFWFKLIPWEYIGWDEPELAQILTEISKNKKAVILNPAYTLLFQSKAILKILWELYPNHPLLLETSSQSILGKTCVEKVLFGREGANVRIITPSGTTETLTEGEYFEQNTVFQEYTEFIKDAAGNSREAFHYQAGVFFVGEACGLGFRRGGKILDNKAQFCGHLIEG
jgi:glutathionylspermidine synthase